MVKIGAEINGILIEPLEEYFCGLNRSSWGIEILGKLGDKTMLFGYFDDIDSAEFEWKVLRGVFPEIPENFTSENLDDKDWQNAYKEFLKPWNFEDLHWVPLWMRETYAFPENEKVFYFDAGMAFGTGDHPTTRLCAMGMLKYVKKCGGDVSKKSLIDAGCGSGILALTARLYGFGEVFGFDRDEEAVTVSRQNADLNSISGAEFSHAGIERALGNGAKADMLLANIQADVLCLYAENLANAVKSGGVMILSGILAEENDKVKKHFLKTLGSRTETCEAFFMGDWSSLEFNLK